MEFLVKHVERLIGDINDTDDLFGDELEEVYVKTRGEVVQLLQDYAGDSYFLKDIQFTISRYGSSDALARIKSTLKGFRDYITSGLANPVSLQRQAQITVVNDFLEQADLLLNDTKVHPVAPIVIIGASLEEFLRNWCIDAQLLTDEMKGSIDKYAQLLRGKELINKQDVKDIASWGGLRNEAAHGHWQGAGSRETARLMLMGVNLFTRKYAPESRTTDG